MPTYDAALNRWSTPKEAVAGRGSAHWLRHTGAQAALAGAKGRNLEDVRALLGHASSRTTMIYLEGYDWDVASAVGGIANPLHQEVGG